jgi:hypothetical protein
MPNKIKPKRSYTTNSVPLTTDLETNELAINWADGVAYTKNASGQIVSVPLGGSGGGGSGLSWASVPASATATGTAGQIAYDGEYFYVATGANTWKRTALATWATFTPATITGLQLWLDASDATTLYDATSGGSLVAADGGVARWEDKSGNARHATQGTSGSRPLRKASVQGGKDVLRFDGSNDSLSIASSTATFKLLHSADSTVFLVFKSGTTANPGQAGYVVLATGNGSSSQIGFELATIDSDPSTANDAVSVFTVRGSSGTWPVYTFENNYFASNTFGLISLVSKPADATASNRVALRKNGGNLSTNNAPSGVQTVNTGNASNDLAIGAYGGQASGFLNGDIAEIIVYDSALSDANREAVENYLLAKWGI